VGKPGEAVAVYSREQREHLPMMADSVLSGGAKVFSGIIGCSMADCISGRRRTISQVLPRSLPLQAINPNP